MHPARGRIDLIHQRVGVGGFQLLQLPPFQDARRQLMALVGQGLQHRGIGAPGPRLHPLAALQAHLVEQLLAQLLGAADVELMPGQAMAVALHHQHALLEIDRHAAQIIGVDFYPFPFHVQQDRDQPALHLLIQHQHLRGAQPRMQRLPQP